MIRIVVRTADRAAAANVGGPVDESIRTFDLMSAVDGDMLRQQLEALEKFMREPTELNWTYVHRQVTGVEVLP